MQLETSQIARHSYQSPVIDRLRESDFQRQVGRVTVRCAERFGFCWGVDKAVSMVHDALADGRYRQIWLLSQIIHNPTVNRDLVDRGVKFLKGAGAPERAFARVARDDLVVIPAFSAEVNDLRRVQAIGCDILDTTCPWVERPHRRTERLIAEGYTSVIHGKVGHDETRATCSLIQSRGGHFVVVLDLAEADAVCAAIAGRLAPGTLLERLKGATSPDFDLARHLERVGLINQTTMLASESREIGQRLGRAMRHRYGDAGFAERFRDFDTICSATQENQDAVMQLAATAGLDLMIVVGGFESSNTHNLARVAAGRVPTFHIEDAGALAASVIRHKDAIGPNLLETADWLPPGPITVGFTAGASTPDDTLGRVIVRVVELAGEDPAPLSWGEGSSA